MMPPKALFLDVGWTLLYPRQSLWEIFAAISAETDARLQASEVEQLVHGFTAANRARAREEFAARTAYTDSDAEFVAQFAALAQLVFSAAGVSGDHAGGARRFFETFWNRDNWVLFPDVIPSLQRLRGAGIRLGVLSNAASNLADFLARLGLSEYFDFVVISAAEGMKKPDRRIFERALQRAGVRPAEAIHVGDMYVEDILGARNVGIRALLIERGRQAMFPNHPVSVDHPDERFEVVRSLSDVVAAVGIA